MLMAGVLIRRTAEGKEIAHRTFLRDGPHA